MYKMCIYMLAMSPFGTQITGKIPEMLERMNAESR